MSADRTYRDRELPSGVAANADAGNPVRRSGTVWPVFSLISQWLVRNAAAKATAAYVIVLVWASLVASSYAEPTTHRWFVAHASPLASRAWFLFDIASNVGLYVPVGALTAMMLIQRGSGAVAALLRSVLAAAALSLCLETLQIYVPNRVSSMVDLGANVAGASVGALLGVMFQQTIRRVWRSVLRPVLVSPILFAPAAWLMFVVVGALWPIELPVRSAELAAANPPGSGAFFGRLRLHLEELASITPMSTAYLWELQITIEYVIALVTASVMFGVLGLFWVSALRREFGVHGRAAFGAAAWIGVITCLCLGAMRAVLPSAGFDPTWVLFALAGLAVGAGLEAIRRRGERDDAPLWELSGETRRLVIAAALLFIVVCESAPFLIRTQDVAAGKLLTNVDWVPFHAYLMQRLPRGVEQIGERFARWAILGFVIASGWHALSRRVVKERVGRLAFRVLLFASALEAVQTLMPTRTADVTDVMLAVFGVVSGALLRQARPRSTQLEDAAALRGALAPGAT